MLPASLRASLSELGGEKRESQRNASVQVIWPDENWVRGDGGRAVLTLLQPGSVEVTSIELSGECSILPAQETTLSIAIIPAAFVTHLSRIIPRAQLKKHAEALGYAVEDVLIAEPESQHIAIGSIIGSEESALRVIDRALLVALIDRCAGMGLRLERVVSELDLLPPEGDGVSLLVGGDHIVLRQGYEGSVWGADNREFLVASIRKCEPNTIAARHSGPIPPWASSALIALGAQLTNVENMPVWLARQASDSIGVNLLQGPFAPRHENDTWSVGARLLGIATIAVLIASIYFGVMTSLVESEQERRRAETRTAFAALFPDAPKELGVRQASEAKIRAYRARKESQGELLPFANLMGDLIAAWPSAGPSDAVLKQVQYTAGDREAYVDIQNLAIPEAEVLQASLGERGYEVKILSVTEARGEGAEQVVRLRIRVGGRA